MELRELRYFVAVAEEGSFTRGAQRVHVVQSAASGGIARLERELGASLFERRGRDIELTQAGQSLLVRARLILAAERDARDEIGTLRGRLQGSITIGTVLTSGAFDLVAVLRQFRLHHPDVAIRMRFSPAPYYRHLDLLAGTQLDAAIFPVPARLPVGVWMDRISEAQLVLACAPDHPLAGACDVPHSGLRNQRFVEFPSSWGIRGEIDALFAAEDWARDVVLEVDDISTALSAIGHGLGIGFVPAESLARRPDLAVVGLAQPPAATPLGFAVINDKAVSPATAALRHSVIQAVSRNATVLPMSPPVC